MSDKLPIGCAGCAKAKTVHLTQIVGEDVNKLDLCHDCPLTKKVASVEAVNIVCDINPKVEPASSGLKSTEKGIECPQCGFTQDTFKETGRLGCPGCYDVFSSTIDTVLKKAHRGTSHKGKRPAKFEPAFSLEEITALKNELKERVAREEYEKAAELRDRILELEARIY